MNRRKRKASSLDEEESTSESDTDCDEEISDDRYRRRRAYMTYMMDEEEEVSASKSATNKKTALPSSFSVGARTRLRKAGGIRADKQTRSGKKFGISVEEYEEKSTEALKAAQKDDVSTLEELNGFFCWIDSFRIGAKHGNVNTMTTAVWNIHGRDAFWQLVEILLEHAHKPFAQQVYNAFVTFLNTPKGLGKNCKNALPLMWHLFPKHPAFVRNCVQTWAHPEVTWRNSKMFIWQELAWISEIICDLGLAHGTLFDPCSVDGYFNWDDHDFLLFATFKPPRELTLDIESLISAAFFERLTVNQEEGTIKRSVYERIGQVYGKEMQCRITYASRYRGNYPESPYFAAITPHLLPLITCCPAFAYDFELVEPEPGRENLRQFFINVDQSFATAIRVQFHSYKTKTGTIGRRCAYNQRDLRLMWRLAQILRGQLKQLATDWEQDGTFTKDESKGLITSMIGGQLKDLPIDWIAKELRWTYSVAWIVVEYLDVIGVSATDTEPLRYAWV